MTLILPDMPGRTAKKMTYRQFLANTPEDLHAEWVDGEMVPMAPISDEHQDVAGLLIALLRTFVNHRGLGFVRHEPFQMKIGPALPGRSPDVLFVSKAHKKRLKKNHLDGPADMVVEIISPESRGRDRGDKFFEYESGGIPEYWLIDPLRKQAEFYERSGDRMFELMPISTGIFQSKVIPGFWLKPEWLWRQPLPTEWSIYKQWKF
jgi:Uma2 family endonuclease